MRQNFVEDPIRWDELPPTEKLRTMIDWFDDFERDDVYDATDEPITSNHEGYPGGKAS